MNLEDNDVTNDSGNTPFEDVLKARLSRRDVLFGGLAGAATCFLAPSSVLASRGGFSANYLLPKGTQRGELIGFEPVAVIDGGGPMPSISADYEYQVLIPWGTPIDPNSSVVEYTGDPNTRPSAADQAEMIGIGHDGMWFFPEKARGRQSNRSGVLCINHEFGTNLHVLGKNTPESLEDVRLSQHAHGVSVVAIAERGGIWGVVSSPSNRRIHVNTPVTFSGPVAGDDLIAASRGDFRGTVNNCSSGYTPWGTYLTCEENFNGYFGDASGGTWTATPEQARYGFSAGGFGYGWEQFDPRFDLSNPNYANEDNRFGWVVEIDPVDGSQTPVKRTALGRFKHEGATVVEGKGGRAVVYMGDDQRFDYIYKFVSADNWKSMRARGVSPLDDGTLYVAKFHDDGTGEWLELTIDDPTLAAEFSSQAEVLTYARIAADLLGATPMDRPEWIAVAPDDTVYCTLTNNSQRTVADAANPLAPNPDGHIIRWKDSERFTGTTLEWDIFIIAADTHSTEDTFSDPDGIWCDPDGRLFIETDGGQKDGLNNQLLVADTRTGELRRLLTGVTSDEITGLTVTPDRRTLFCNTQHPGNGDPTRTNFPAPTDGVTIPRDSTLVVRRKDGGIVGS
jgi:secreted PhoX family phosphatase